MFLGFCFFFVFVFGKFRIGGFKGLKIGAQNRFLQARIHDMGDRHGRRSEDGR